jgi:uncharacterized membrane protein YfcA
VTLIAGLALAVAIGISLGLLGGGGAILTVPVLVYVVGLDVKTAVPTSLVVVGLTAMAGALGHQRAGHIRFRTVLAFAPAAMAGAYLGSFLGLRVSGRLQLGVLGAIILVSAILMMRGAGRPEGAQPAPARPLPVLAGLGLVMGGLTGLLGIGGGFLYVPALTILGGLAMKQAVGTSLVLIALGAATGFAGYVGRVDLDWWLVAGFTALAFLGVGIGTALVPRVSPQALRRGFAVLLLVMGVMVLVRR